MPMGLNNVLRDVQTRPLKVGETTNDGCISYVIGPTGDGLSPRAVRNATWFLLRCDALGVSRIMCYV